MEEIARHFTQFTQLFMQNNKASQTLQDVSKMHQLNENFVLFCLWMGVSKRGRLRANHFKKIQEMLGSWHDQITKQLVSLESLISQSITSKSIDLQNSVHSHIAFSQKVEQSILSEEAGFKTSERSLEQQLSDALYNLVGYFKFLKKPIHADDQQNILSLFQAVFPNIARVEIFENLRGMIAAQKLNNIPCAQLSFE